MAVGCRSYSRFWIPMGLGLEQRDDTSGLRLYDVTSQYVLLSLPTYTIRCSAKQIHEGWTTTELFIC